MAGCGMKTRFIPAAFAWSILLGATAAFFIYPCRELQQTYHFSITVVQTVIALFVISNFFLATFMDPGSIPKASPEEDVEDDFRAPLYHNVEINGVTVRMKWCVTCQFYRPPRCSHCSVCNTCIETFDHHCPWVNNCIGRRNYRHFFFFLVFLCIHMLSIFAWCVLYVLNNKDRLHETAAVVSLVIIGIIGLLFIPIFGLTGFHMVLVSRGRTTNEQVTGKFQGGYNPFSRGCFSNCCYILCGPLYPRPVPPSKHLHHHSGKPGSRSGPPSIHMQFSSLAAAHDSNGVRVYTDLKLKPGGDSSATAGAQPTTVSSTTQPFNSRNGFFI